MGEANGDNGHSWGSLLIIVLIILIIIVASFLVTSYFSGPTSTTTSITNSTNPPIRDLVMCSGFTENETGLNQRIQESNTTVANYDEQLWLGFSGNYTSLNYNVTATIQNDAFGNGPAYILNGLIQENVWYQVGLSWNWGHTTGFQLFYQVWNASSGRALYPFTDGSSSPKVFPNIHANDTVGLFLSFVKGNVLMKGYDWRTKSEANSSFNSLGASQFVSYKSHVSRFPSSLLTEWYHVIPYYCNNSHVVFSNDLKPQTVAWMSVDEWNFTGIPFVQRFNSSAKEWLFGSPLYSQNYSESSKLLSVNFGGTIIYSNSTIFVTM